MGSRGVNDLHAAARSGDLNAVQTILISNPLAVNSRDKHSRTPLHLAAWAGHAEVVTYLCNEKADVGAAAMDDMGAIHFAAQKGHLEVVRTLSSLGVSIKGINRKGLTPLHYAVQGSHIELIKFLLKKGASVTAKSKAGKTPLDLAGSDEIKSILEEHERSVKKESLSKQRASNPEHKSPLPDEADNSVDASHDNDDEREDESVKRKNDEDNTTNDVLPKPKKAKVALSHLLNEDDTQEDEETL